MKYLSGLALFLCIQLAHPGAAGAEVQQNITLYTHDLYPISYEDKTGITGILTEFIKSRLCRNKIKNVTIERVPFSRAFFYASKIENTGVFPLALTPERKELFKWIGPLYKSDVMFYANVANPSFITMDDFRKLEGIGVGRDNASHNKLVSLGFTNLVPLTNEEQALDLLAIGRVNAVPVSETVADSIIAKKSYSSQIVNTKIKLLESELYLALSPNTDVKIFNLLNSALTKTIKSKPTAPQKFEQDGC